MSKPITKYINGGAVLVLPCLLGLALGTAKLSTGTQESIKSAQDTARGPSQMNIQVAKEFHETRDAIKALYDGGNTMVCMIPRLLNKYKLEKQVLARKDTGKLVLYFPQIGLVADENTGKFVFSTETDFNNYAHYFGQGQSGATGDVTVTGDQDQMKVSEDEEDELLAQKKYHEYVEANRETFGFSMTADEFTRKYHCSRYLTEDGLHDLRLLEELPQGSKIYVGKLDDNVFDFVMTTTGFVYDLLHAFRIHSSEPLYTKYQQSTMKLGICLELDLARKAKSGSRDDISTGVLLHKTYLDLTALQKEIYDEMLQLNNYQQKLAGQTVQGLPLAVLTAAKFAMETALNKSKNNYEHKSKQFVTIHQDHIQKARIKGNL